MDISQFINDVAAGNAAQAKETLNDILSNRAFENIDSRKKELAQSIFGGKPEDIEVQDTADTPMEDELLSQEEFDVLSKEDQELYLESLEQLDELSKDEYKKYLKTSDAEMKAHRSGSQSSRYADTAGNRGYKEAGKNNVQDRELNTQNAQKFAKKKLGISTTKKHTPI